MTRAAPAAGRWVALLLAGMVALGGLPATAAEPTAQAGDQRRAESRERAPSRDAIRRPRPPRPGPVTIDTLAPKVLKPGRTIRITGTIRNPTERDWGDVQVGLVTSSDPFTTPAELEEAVAAAGVDPQAYLGERVVDPGTFDDVGTIGPGGSTTYELRVPYSALLLSGADGVYWLGVQANATLTSGRQMVAEHRTLVPLLQEPPAGAVELALLWPVTAPVARGADAFRSDALADQFAREGRLGSLVSMGISAGPTPMTWVLDPALLDTADDMGDGYVVRPDQGVAATSDQAATAAAWRDLILQAVLGEDVLALPYGDPDVASLGHHRLVPLAVDAARLGSLVLDRLRVEHERLLWPAGGLADHAVLAVAGRVGADTALLSPASLPALEPPPPGSPPLPALSREVEDGRVEVLVSEGGAVAARLGPVRGQSVLDWRQSLLARTALMALASGPDDADDAAALVAPPRDFWPDERWAEADFFAALDVPWVRPVTATELTAGVLPTYRGQLVYPPWAAALELPEENLAALRILARTSRTVLSLLGRPSPAWRRLAAAKGLSSSTAWRAAPAIGLAVASSYVRDNRQFLRAIDIEAPTFVTLSSANGRFPVTISNGTDEPVTVGLQVRSSGSPLQIEPMDPVTIDPGQRRSIPVLTSSDGIGVSEVDLRLLTRRGRTFGDEVDFQVRTTQIGAVIWVVMGVGAAVLVVAAVRRIAVRVLGRVRASRRVTA